MPMNQDENKQLYQADAPLVEALIQYRSARYTSFHVPGHKNGRVYMEEDTEESRLLSQVMQIDVTEITGTDDLHHPEGVIAEAQQLAADCFGAEESFFLVGGSTVGNLSLLLTVCSEPGALILVQRNVHKSVLHGLMLTRARVVFLTPQVDAGSTLATAPSAQTVAEALRRYPEAKAVFVTMPNYYGMGFDLSSLAEVCHKSGIPLLVDEAHGAHYGHHPSLPAHAMSCGADAAVQSTHKMLSAMTMGAMLHVQGEFIDREALKYNLSVVQSSSPSYPLMVSLDLARRHLHIHGETAFSRGLEAVNVFKKGLAAITDFQVLEPEQPGAGQADCCYTTQDPFKVVIYDRSGTLQGYELQKLLEVQGCIPEMSDERHVVLVFSLGSTIEDAKHLLEALSHIDIEKQANAQRQGVHLWGAPRAREELQAKKEFSTWNNLLAEQISEQVSFQLRKPRLDETERIPLVDVEDRIAAEMVIPYPPGIPLLYVGELITGQMKRKLEGVAAAGTKCQGVADPNLDTIVVYKK